MLLKQLSGCSSWIFMLLQLYKPYFRSIWFQNSGTACSIHTPWAAPLTYFSLVMGPPAGLCRATSGQCQRGMQTSRRWWGRVVVLGICDWHQHKSSFISPCSAECHGHTHRAGHRYRPGHQHMSGNTFSVIWVSGARVNALLTFGLQWESCRGWKEKRIIQKF